MNSHALIALLLCGSLVMIDSSGPFVHTLIAVNALKVSSITMGALAVIAGALLERSNRQKRNLSPQEQEEAVEAALRVAQQIDEYGCVSKLMCKLGALPDEQLSQAGHIIKEAFGNPNSLHIHDVDSAHRVYDLDLAYGTKFGKTNPNICDQEFEKCQMNNEELFGLLESQFSTC